MTGRTPASNRLAGKVCIITGTGGSIGREAALLFAREGALLVGCSLNVDDAIATVEPARAAGGTMVSMQPCNLSKAADCQALVDLAVQTFGRVDVLFSTGSRTSPTKSEGALAVEDRPTSTRSSRDDGRPPIQRIRKMVQAAGRVSWTTSDRGTVHLIDDRFARAEVRRLLPQWWGIETERGYARGTQPSKSFTDQMTATPI